MDWSDTSIRWDHAHEGVVTDVVRGKHGVQVVVKTAKPLEDGDKLAGRWGNKGVIAIKEDNEMPHDESGQALDAVISPLAIPSRGNSSFPIEMILGKIAKKTGVPYKIKDFTGEDMREFGRAFRPDVVLMNPPFSKGQDVKHVTHALGFLKPGGRLVAIMGAGVTFRQDKRTNEFRELVQAMGGTIERLPEGSFKSSGTMVNTVIVVIDKQ
jgi:hypothetical protein